VLAKRVPPDRKYFVERFYPLSTDYPPEACGHLQRRHLKSELRDFPAALGDTVVDSIFRSRSFDLVGMKSLVAVRERAHLIQHP